MPSHIWIVNQFANTPDVPGHTRQYELGRFLADQGYEVSIFASDYNLAQRRFRKLKFPQLWSSETLDKVNFNWLYATPYQRNDWQRYLNMLSFILSLFLRVMVYPKPDLVIGSSPQLLAAFGAWILARIRGAKFYFEVRDLWPQSLIELSGKSPNSPLIKALAAIERWLYCHSDRTIVLSSGSVNYVRERGAERVSWLPNGPDLETFEIALSIQAAKVRYNIDPNRFCLMYAGAHGTANALHTVVEAARILDQQHPDRFQILLIGDGPEKAQLQQQAKGVKCLEFRASIPKDDIPKLLRGADGAILTLKDIPLFRYGVSPNKLYDYYAAGKPVIAAVGGMVNEEVCQYGLGFVANPENPLELAQAMQQLQAAPEPERMAMGKHAQALIEQSYSRKKIAQELHELLQKDLES